MSQSPTTVSRSYCPNPNPVATAAVGGVARVNARISIAEFAEKLGRLVGEKLARDEREEQHCKHL